MKKFFLSCWVILTLTAWAKLYSATGHQGILNVADPLLGVSNRVVLLVAGAVELGVATCLLAAEDGIIKCVFILWLSLNFVLYRVGIAWLFPGKLCPCLGNLTDKLGLKPGVANWILKVVIAYMLAGGFFFWLKEWRLRRPMKNGGRRVDEPGISGV